MNNQLRQDIIKRKRTLERKRLKMSFEEKLKELEEIVEWVDPEHWKYPSERTSVRKQ